MKNKEFLSKNSKGLLESFNQVLVEKGISTKERPFVISKIQFYLAQDSNQEANNMEVINGRKCILWDSRLEERTHPVTKKKYWQLVEWCVQYADDI